MKWFKHMSNMRHDPKIKRLKKQYGADGYSIYVEIITAISDNLDPINNILPFLEEDISEIADEFGMAEHKAIDIVNFCVDQGLLEKSTNDYIFCFKIYKFVDEYFTKKQANTVHVADRNKEVITAYKNKGLPETLKVLQKYLPDFMNAIGLIEVSNNNKRSTLALLTSNSGVGPDQVCLDKSILNKNKLDNIILDNTDPSTIFGATPDFNKSGFKEDIKKTTKHKHGEYKHVMLTDEEYDSLNSKLSDREDLIKRLDEYIETSGKTYKNHSLVMQNWDKKNPTKKPIQESSYTPPENPAIAAMVKRHYAELEAKNE